MIRENLELGIKDGSIRGEIDINRALILFFAYTHGVMHTVISKEDVYLDVLGLDSDEVEKSAMEFIEYFLKRREK